MSTYQDTLLPVLNVSKNIINQVGKTSTTTQLLRVLSVSKEIFKEIVKMYINTKHSILSVSNDPIN